MTAADLNSTDRLILQGLLAGQRSKDIGERLTISFHAVDQRIRRLRQKVGVRTLLQLGAWAERHGIREGQS